MLVLLDLTTKVSVGAKSYWLCFRRIRCNIETDFPPQQLFPFSRSNLILKCESWKALCSFFLRTPSWCILFNALYGHLPQYIFLLSRYSRLTRIELTRVELNSWHNVCIVNAHIARSFMQDLHKFALKFKFRNKFRFKFSPETILYSLKITTFSCALLNLSCLDYKTITKSFDLFSSQFG